MGRASFRLFQKGRASRKGGRAPRPAKEASTLDTTNHGNQGKCQISGGPDVANSQSAFVKSHKHSWQNRPILVQGT